MRYCLQVVTEQRNPENPASVDNTDGWGSVDYSPEYPSQTLEVDAQSDSPILQQTMPLYSLEAVTFQQV